VKAVVHRPLSNPLKVGHLETHHTRRLSDGGPDHPRGVVAVRPNYHRRAHHAADAITYNEYLGTIAERLAASFSGSHQVAGYRVNPTSLSLAP
jgi:hypothetical protein